MRKLFATTKQTPIYTKSCFQRWNFRRKAELVRGKRMIVARAALFNRKRAVTGRKSASVLSEKLALIEKLLWKPSSTWHNILRCRVDATQRRCRAVQRPSARAENGVPYTKSASRLGETLLFAIVIYLLLRRCNTLAGLFSTCTDDSCPGATAYGTLGTGW